MITANDNQTYKRCKSVIKVEIRSFELNKNPFREVLEKVYSKSK